MLEVIVFLTSALLTYITLKIAKAKKILDLPNERSSHSTPTPRGGGIAIVLTFFGATSWLYMNGQISDELYGAIFCSLPLVLVSLIDDIISLRPSVRLAGQLISAIAALVFLKNHLVLDLYFFKLEGILITPFYLLVIIWLTNLYNFLDGIDGYAASEAIFVSLGAYLFFQSPLFLVLAAASLGFLIFNWEKASIFMGDVGSSFLGFVFSIMIIYFSDSQGAAWIWLVLLGLFWIDATVTLFRRFRNGEKLTQAHRNHAYQRIVQAGYSHGTVVIIGMLVNVLGLIFIWVFQNSKLLPLVAMCIILLMYLLIKLIDKKEGYLKV